MEDIEKVIQEFKEKNYESFDEFYNLTYRQVYYGIYSIIPSRAICEDLLQETYMKFLNNLEKYEANTNIYNFLYTIGRNVALNEYNKRKREVIDDEYFENLEDQESDKSILELLKYLSVNEREIVSLHIVNNLKFKEISKITNKPLGTVLWEYNKAIKKLKKEVNNIDEES